MPPPIVTKQTAYMGFSSLFSPTMIWCVQTLDARTVELVATEKA